VVRRKGGRLRESSVPTCNLTSSLTVKISGEGDMRFPLSGLLFLLLVVPPVVAQQNSQHTLPNSPKGFDKQYKNAFDAYDKALEKELETPKDKTFLNGDAYEKASIVYRKIFRKKDAYKKTFAKGIEQDLMERFRTFAVPEHWFSDVFGPDQGPELAKEYQELFNGFESATKHEFSTPAGRENGQAYLATKAWRTSEVKSARPAPTSLEPLPPVQRFRISYYVRPESDCFCTTPGGYAYSRVDTFIYVDGAFRFIGGGACPFWATPCSPNLPLWLPNWGFTSD
jgi:hypothetical protein